MLGSQWMSCWFDEEGSTDSEERAFVDKLAIDDLLDEAAGDFDANFDDEDPDREDWDDVCDNVYMNSEERSSSQRRRKCTYRFYRYWLPVSTCC